MKIRIEASNVERSRGLRGEVLILNLQVTESVGVHASEEPGKPFPLLPLGFRENKGLET